MTDSPNPLFTPWSEYNRFRDRMAPLEKLRGYFLELVPPRDRRRAPAPAEAPPWADEPSEADAEAELVGAGAGYDDGVGGGDGGGVALVLDRNGAKLPWLVSAAPYYDPQTETKRFRAEWRAKNGSHDGTFRVPSPAANPGGTDTECRLFVIDPEIIPALENLAGTDQLEEAFAARRVAGSRELAVLLSALPDVDGLVTADWRLNLGPVDLPAACFAVRALRPGTVLVLVLDVDGTAP